MAAGSLRRFTTISGGAVLPEGSQASARAGAGNVSEFIHEEINGRTYLAWLDKSNPNADREVLLSTVGSENSFNILSGVDYPWDADVAHLYREGMTVTICSPTHRMQWVVVKGASLADKQINPSTPSPAYRQVSVTPL